MQLRAQRMFLKVKPVLCGRLSGGHATKMRSETFQRILVVRCDTFKANTAPLA